ncbi:MAG: hypothetical protein J5895_03710 [Alphaproteobacteria bacterium]|nr:hypothetical protein [Alphaproteobacteria bacterium]
MKPLLVLARIIFVGGLWSIIFIEGIRVIVLENWRFDIFWPPHWVYAWNLWQSGWIIDTPKEWAFILILLAFIPLWLTGWIALSLVPWESIVWRIISLPFKILKKSTAPLKMVVPQTPVVVKKKSYKEVRPVGKRTPIYDYSVPQSTPVPTQNALTVAAENPNPVKQKAVTARETLNHNIFNLDDEDDDFDLDIDSFDKADIFKIDTAPKNKQNADEGYASERVRRKPSKTESFDLDDEDDDDLEAYEPTPVRSAKSARVEKRRDMYADDSRRTSRRSSKREKADKQRRFESEERAERTSRRASLRDDDFDTPSSPIEEILEDKGYLVLKDVQIQKTAIDYAAIDEGQVVLCLIDNQSGDWLADEERFNDEEPLWFSENSHRVSPVRKLDLARQKLEDALDDSDFDLSVKPYLIVTKANIINAEDMLDVWDDMDIEVVRFAKGGPADLRPLSKAIGKADGRLSRNDVSELKKMLKRLA